MWSKPQGETTTAVTTLILQALSNPYATLVVNSDEGLQNKGDSMGQPLT